MIGDWSSLYLGRAVAHTVSDDGGAIYIDSVCSVLESQFDGAPFRFASLDQFAQIVSIFDALHALVYVADMHTHELLFVNDHFVTTFGTEVLGRPCFEVMHADQAVPCPFCSNDLLVHDGVPQPPHVWEFRNTSSGRWYKCIGKAIPWSGHRLVRMEVAVDVTERKAAEHGLKESLDKLHKTLEGTIQAMAMVVETRDPYTAGHQRRVTKLACIIAQELGLTESQLQGVRVAATVHDIGKICVPAEILSKPGKLSPIESGLIEMHPQAGYDVLRSIEFPWPVAQIVCQHHERVDGSGYPFRLKGGELLLEAKILGVADVVEAMASHRPYRPTLGIEKALDEIVGNRGILYDPEVADTCAKVFRDRVFGWSD